mmetsp:Transcript_29148/g.57144  ORF Transcript_29148/g.57144 Transcript_29148/m.57144 type:complete len:215 (+) Transcript_29148:1551-2195(+)
MMQKKTSRRGISTRAPETCSNNATPFCPNSERMQPNRHPTNTHMRSSPSRGTRTNTSRTLHPGRSSRQTPPLRETHSLSQQRQLEGSGSPCSPSLQQPQRRFLTSLVSLERKRSGHCSPSSRHRGCLLALQLARQSLFFLELKTKRSKRKVKAERLLLRSSRNNKRKRRRKESRKQMLKREREPMGHNQLHSQRRPSRSSNWKFDVKTPAVTGL